jgi:hypothetical protein
MLVWTRSNDNTGVVGYEVDVGGRRARVTSSTASLRGIRCGKQVTVRVVAVDRALNRSRRASTDIRVPGCAQSAPGWFGGFDTGDTSQWDYIHRFAPERFRVVNADGAVRPRQGAYMARVEVRGGEPTTWTSGANASLIEKTAAPDDSGRLGADTYVGFSVFLPKGFDYAPNDLFNNIFAWHGDTSDVQASVHLTIDSIIGRAGNYGISNPRPGFVVDLHTQPGYHPAMFRLGDLVTGRWVDIVIHTRWAKDDTGIIEGWMDGVLRFSSRRPTWYPNGEINSVKPEIGYYRRDRPGSAVLYVDAFKIGRTYASVAP